MCIPPENRIYQNRTRVRRRDRHFALTGEAASRVDGETPQHCGEYLETNHKTPSQSLHSEGAWATESERNPGVGTQNRSPRRR
jgi:hypothetical protein